MSMILNLLIILAAIIGAPLFAVLGMLSVSNFHFSGASLLIVAQEISSKIVSVPLLSSIPLFTFAGYMLASGGFSKRMVRFTKALIGWMPGGLAIVTLVVCCLFTVFTGASGVTIVALGGFLFPALLSEKYEEKFALGLVTTSGSLGLLFPPSLPLILFGVVASANIDQLFIAGLLPGSFLLLVLAGYAIYEGIKDKVERTKFSWKELGAALWEIKWELPLPFLLVAGVYSGNLALSDAAAFTVAYVFVVEIFILRDIHWRELGEIIKKSMVIVGAIILIMSVSFAGTNFIVYHEIPQKLFQVMQTFVTNKYMFLILLNIFLLIVGCIMDIFTALMIVVPLIAPIAYQYNVNLIHLGIIFLANLEIGYLTPPVGMNLFISSMRFKKPVVQLYGASLRFIGLLLFSLVVITYIPEMSLWFMEKPSIVGKWQYQEEQTGLQDEILLKSGGNYLRKQSNIGDITAMMAPYVKGYYRINGKTLFLEDRNSEGEEYRFEIYNDGKRLLLMHKEEPEPVDVLNAFGEIETVSPQRKKFYINQLQTPLSTSEGKLIGLWKDGKNTFEFDYDRTVKITGEGGTKEYSYETKKNRIKLKENNEEMNIVPVELDLKFLDEQRIVISNKATAERWELYHSTE